MAIPELESIKTLLHYDWDPIGIAGMEGAIDEYDSYAMEVYIKFKSGRSIEEVAEYLGWVSRQHIGVGSDPDREKSIADAASKLMGI